MVGEGKREKVRKGRKKKIIVVVIVSFLCPVGVHSWASCGIGKKKLVWRGIRILIVRRVGIVMADTGKRGMGGKDMA